MKSKIRVAFCLQLSEGWLGGVNYYKNLLQIISNNPKCNIEPVIFMPKNRTGNLLEGFPDIEYVETSILEGRKSFHGFIAGVERRLFKRNFELERLLSAKHIDVVSHWNEIYRIGNKPTMGWIPDFQHKYLPEFFSLEERKTRDYLYEAESKAVNCVMLSSNNALNDYVRYYPEFKDKAVVYQFVVPHRSFLCDGAKLRDKYRLNREFIFCPNQFWQHKNHRIIVEALKLLEEYDIQIVCSGNTEDYRNKGYFPELISLVKKNHLENKFRILGLIPYTDVQGLMLECKALLNPSLFEGWNTMVEEGKTLGKRMILSNLDVHQEQAAPGAIYFDRFSAEDLAKALRHIWSDKSFNDGVLVKQAINDNAEREKIAADKYREILEMTMERFY